MSRQPGSLGCLLQEAEEPIRYINQSELVTFLRCRRKWDWSYIKGLTTDGYNTNLETGSAVHAGLAAYYRGQDPFDAMQDYWLPWVDVLEDMNPRLEKDIALSGIMMEGYLEWLEEEAEDAGLTPVAVEEKVEMLLKPGIMLHGTLDLVQRDEDGRLWLFDHKTTAAFGQLADRRLQMNFQLMTYAVLCEDYFGEAPAGARLNMLRKVQRTASAKPPFYQRETVHFNKYQLANHRNHMLAILADMDRAHQCIIDGDNAVAYPVVDGDCSWKCPFLSVCAMADDGSDIDGALNELYVRRDRS